MLRLYEGPNVRNKANSVGWRRLEARKGVAKQGPGWYAVTFVLVVESEWQDL